MQGGMIQAFKKKNRIPFSKLSCFHVDITIRSYYFKFFVSVQLGVRLEFSDPKISGIW